MRDFKYQCPLSKPNISIDVIGGHVQNYNKSNHPVTSTNESPIDQHLPPTSSECYGIGLRADETLTINDIKYVPQYKHVAKEKVTQIPYESVSHVEGYNEGIERNYGCRPNKGRDLEAPPFDDRSCVESF